MPSQFESMFARYARPQLTRGLGRSATDAGKVVHKPAGGANVNVEGAIVYGFGGGQEVGPNGVALETVGTIEIPKDVIATVKTQDVWGVAGVDYDTREIRDGQIGFWLIVVGRLLTQERSLEARSGR